MSKDEITVVVDLSSHTTTQVIDYDDPDATTGNAVDDLFAHVVRAYARYFNDRYQTYGRRVHFYGARGGASTEQIQAEIAQLAHEVRPFAVLPARVVSAPLVAREAARAGMLGVSFSAFDRAVQAQLAPRLLSFAPDLQDQASIAASFVCRKLAGGSARLSGNVADRSRTRELGLVYRATSTEPEFAVLARLVKKELAGRCGASVVEQSAGRVESDLATHGVNMARFRSDGVTTVVALGMSSNHLGWSNAGADMGYLPEWIIPGSLELSGADTNNIARQMSPPFWANTVGITYDRRRHARSGQDWYRAYRETCTACPNVDDFRNARLYDQLTLLFWGIQAAGPRLTATNLDRGLHAIPPRRSSSPEIQAAYFSPGNYSFVKDAPALWWDGAGTEPGTGNIGCYRLALQGLRFRTGEWNTGDNDLRAGGQPCQGASR